MGYQLNPTALLARIPPRVLPRHLSRRRFLQLGFATASTAAGLSSRSITAHLSPDGDLLEFRRLGVPIWRVCTGSFAGSPRLYLRTDSEEIEFGLSQAQFPGLELVADFSCLLTRAASHWRAEWRWNSLGTTVFAFEPWLAGRETASCKWPSRVVARSTGASVNHVRFESPARVAFQPDWTFHSENDTHVAITYGRRVLAGTRWTARIADPAEVPLVPTARRRTEISVQADTAGFAFRPPTLGIPHARLLGNWDAFDRLVLEFGDGDMTTLGIVAVAPPGARFAFQPGPDFRALDGDPYQLPLEHLTYSFEPAADAASIVARVPNAPGILAAGGVQLVIGGGEAGTPFTWSRAADQSVSLGCAPRIDAASAPIDGVSSRLALREDARSLPFILPGENLPSGQSAVRLGEQPDVRVAAGELEILRPTDLLSLRLQFVNLALHAGRHRGFFGWLLRRRHPSTLRRIDASQPAYLVAHFAPQHVAEKAFFEDSTESTSELPIAPVSARFAEPSRLAFRVPAGLEKIEYTLNSLLDWKRLEPSIVPVAQSRERPPDETAEIREPHAHETALELPYRLVLSPHEQSAWSHRVQPVTRRDADAQVTWAELWRTTLGISSGADGSVILGNDLMRTVRAVFARLPGAANVPPPPCERGVDPPTHRGTVDGLDALSDRDRYEIVQLSANVAKLVDGDTGQPIDPIPINVQHLALSAQGAWFSAQGNWGPTDVKTDRDPIELSLREWRQETSLGRDQYVRAVYGGYLYLYGHRANLIQITERRFQRRDGASPIKAYLRQRIFVTIEEPVKEYGDQGLDPAGRSVDRQMPLRRIEVTTLITPSLDRPTDLEYPCYFWPKVFGRAIPVPLHRRRLVR